MTTYLATEHIVSVYKVGWCYGVTCSCGLRLAYLSARRQEAAHDAVRHVQQSGSMADEDSWVPGDVSDYPETHGSWAEVPKLRLTVHSRDRIEVHTQRGIITETLMELAQ